MTYLIVYAVSEKVLYFINVSFNFEYIMASL